MGQWGSLLAVVFVIIADVVEHILSRSAAPSAPQDSPDVEGNLAIQYLGFPFLAFDWLFEHCSENLVRKGGQELTQKNWNFLNG